MLGSSETSLVIYCQDCTSDADSDMCESSHLLQFFVLSLPKTTQPRADGIYFLSCCQA